ncbi:aldehyde dehydrogenase [Schizophyllum commune H4-8]|uniref:Aldehyde dehydrogenase n=1 Tax=Schizophyllum commune (strain H4-8 / FGSC 9210) TaxID=578458 RepID=D8QJX8_SCHCM|nr:aldehyde dehydrogenase [Schizophyllum commune H4-8]KAI5885611.1 aldehyde dehydrogenase [Schizophyllum commune H4-8]
MVELKYTPLDEIDKIRTSLHAGFQTGKSKSLAYRKYQLLQLGHLLKENRARFVEAIHADMGRPVFETEFYEITGALTDITAAVKSLSSWAKPETSPFNFNWFAMRPRAHKVPKGVVLVITPFNYPVWLVVEPLIGALAAGCAVCLKPSESAAATSALWTELLPKYLDPDLVRVVNGAVPETTRLLELQWDHISYTGSGAVGRIVASAAAKHLTPVTLELGGKSPVIVDASADPALAARRVLLGRFVNAGQTCVSPDYVLVVKGIKDRFLQEVRKSYAAFTAASGDPSSKSGLAPTTFSHLIHSRAYARISGMLEKTRGKVIAGGERDEKENFVGLTVVEGVEKEDALMGEEIFGPVLPILEVEHVDEAIKFINGGDRPLALYVFANDKKVKDKVRNETISGTMAFNEVVIQLGAPGLPFGGTGASGYGYHRGKYGFDAFTHVRTEMDSPAFIDKILWWRFPPYTDAKLRAMLRMMKDGLPAKPKGPPRLDGASEGGWRKWAVVLLAVTAAAAAVKRARN